MKYTTPDNPRSLTPFPACISHLLMFKYFLDFDFEAHFQIVNITSK
ncbi:hypothetical protein M837_00848 [Streptococcus equi subsp. zooepidemicus SzS31A1]|uniref:Transposase n=2 Tax=Streptococcus equi subsp. zooepidemicus TaxID=40041 RepID=A0ABN0MW58_STRSZ|nr:hypothetical protein M837_00848 [Streptococcus equi subsp. zooepidemicus SzS31A1]KIS06777.1 hypothetical protein AT54_01462 [Streptococcus equi subsp. zooepidemicus Sz12is]KIS17722.1 hypothetical protein AT55_01566 [Streptococcus equi subsp. zooepidemicus Sz4is]